MAPKPKMHGLEFRTPGYNGYAVKYSPYYQDSLALAASSNYGLVGTGRLYILGLDARGIACTRIFETPDACYDLAWNEANEKQLLVALGDGTVKLFDCTSEGNDPVVTWQEHKREVYAVCFNLVTKDSFVSSSWDGTIKIWSPNRQDSMITIPTHSCTYSAAFSPHSPSIVSCTSSDSHLRIYDLRVPASAANHLVHLIPAHGFPPTIGSTMNGQQLPPSYPPSEILTHDWNKYRSSIVATAGVDQLIRTFDIRNPRAGPVAILKGHDYAVRRISWCPHLPDVLMSGSYDMTARIWTDGSTMGVPSRPALSGPEGWGDEIGRLEDHTEFVTGVDWCLFGTPGWVASTAWDERVRVFDVRKIMGPGPHAARFGPGT